LRCMGSYARLKQDGSGGGLQRRWQGEAGRVRAGSPFKEGAVRFSRLGWLPTTVSLDSRRRRLCRSLSMTRVSYLNGRQRAGRVAGGTTPTTGIQHP
jgi:hypothetical protein